MLEAEESLPPFLPFFLIGFGLLVPLARIPLIFFLSSFLTLFLTELLVLELLDDALLGALLSFFEVLPLDVPSLATSLSILDKFFSKCQFFQNFEQGFPCIFCLSKFYLSIYTRNFWREVSL